MNKTIINTRPYSDMDDFGRILKNAGAEVQNFPMISIEQTNDEIMNKIIADIDEYDAVFFTSMNSVRIIFDKLRQLNKVYKGRIYAVGEKTKEYIEQYGYEVYFCPDKFSSDELITTLNKEELRGRKIFFPCGSLSMNTFLRALEEITEVHKAVIYKTKRPVFDSEYDELRELLINKKVDCIAFFSPSAVENFKKFAKGIDINDIDFAAIGQSTITRAESNNLKINIKPDRSTSGDLANAIIKYYNN